MLCSKLITSTIVCSRANTSRRFVPVSIIIVRNAKTKVTNLNETKNKVLEPQQVQTTLVGKFFGKYLLLTNTVSSGLLMIAGDVICQEIEYRRGELKERYDCRRICM